MNPEERELLLLLAETTFDVLLRLAVERRVLNSADTEPLFEQMSQIKMIVQRLRSVYSSPGV
jgi:hypothetical protein